MEIEFFVVGSDLHYEIRVDFELADHRAGYEQLAGVVHGNQEGVVLGLDELEVGSRCIAGTCYVLVGVEF